MRICFSYQNLFPATSRAARHVETLIRRFQEHGHEVSVITTPVADANHPDGLEMLRLRDAPGAKGRGRGDTLLGKAIARFLRQYEVDVLFAEGLTPLTAVTVKAAKGEGIKTIIRALADTEGLVHSIGGEKRLTPSALKKRLKTILGHADAVAASSARCSNLLGEIHGGEIVVIDKCVDLSVFDVSRVQDFDKSDLRDRLSLEARPTVLYARDEMRADTVISTIPFMKSVSEIVPAVCMLVSGEIDDLEAVTQAITEAGLSEQYRLLGATEQRDVFAAYAESSAFILPSSSRATETEILEAMSMGCPVVCLKDDAATILEVVDDGTNAVVIAVDEEDAGGSALVDLMRDPERQEVIKSGARTTAEANDIHRAMNHVGHLCETLLGLPLTDYDHPLERPDEQEVEDDSAAETADEVTKATDAEEASEEADADAEDAPDDTVVDTEEPPVDEEADRERNPDDESAEAAADDDRADEEGDSRPRRRRRRRRRRSDESESEASESEASDEEASDEEASDEEAEISADHEDSDDSPPKPSQAELLDAANQRLKDLDPKLTLKELMPFLRPPRNLYIMSIPSASGQHRAGDALLGAFKNVDQNLRISAINILELLGKGHSREEVMDLLHTLSSDSALFGKVYENDADVESSSESDESAADADPFSKLFGPKLKKLIVDKTPDQIVVTHFLPLKSILALRSKHGLRMKVNVVITDYDLHPHWISEGVDHYYVPSEKVRFKMIRAGVPSEIIEVVGVPVSQSFSESVNRDRIRRNYKLKKGAPCILFRPGGIRPTEAVLETIEHLSNFTGSSFNLLVLTGRDEALKESVEAIKTSKEIKVQATGFVENIHELMGMADLLITRANGHTVAEACAAGIPLVLLRPAPGLEERTADWFVERGVALKAHDANDLEWVLSDLLCNNGRQLKSMGEAARNGAAGRRGSAGLSAERMARRI